MANHCQAPKEAHVQLAFHKGIRSICINGHIFKSHPHSTTACEPQSRSHHPCYFAPNFYLISSHSGDHSSPIRWKSSACAPMAPKNTKVINVHHLLWKLYPKTSLTKSSHGTKASEPCMEIKPQTSGCCCWSVDPHHQDRCQESCIGFDPLGLKENCCQIQVFWRKLMVSRHQVKKVILPMVDCMGFEVLKLVTNISFFWTNHLPSENPNGNGHADFGHCWRFRQLLFHVETSYRPHFWKKSSLFHFWLSQLLSPYASWPWRLFPFQLFPGPLRRSSI